MIDLKVQYSIILFSLLYGLFFYYLLYICKDYLNINNHFYRIINTLSFFLFMSIIYFIGIEIVCGGIFHIYSFIIIIVVGLIEHYMSKVYK